MAVLTSGAGYWTNGTQRDRTIPIIILINQHVGWTLSNRKNIALKVGVLPKKMHNFLNKKASCLLQILFKSLFYNNFIHAPFALLHGNIISTQIPERTYLNRHEIDRPERESPGGRWKEKEDDDLSEH